MMTASLHAILLVFSAVLLPPHSYGFSSEDLSGISCYRKCFLTNATRELMCSDTLPPSVDAPLKCEASPVRGGVKITVGNLEDATRIHPDGLVYFRKKYAAKRMKLHLELRLRLHKIELKPLKVMPHLQKLSFFRLNNDSIDPCLFADRNFSAGLTNVFITCLGSGTGQNYPVQFLWPVSQPPAIIKLNCGLKQKCYQCEGAFSGMLWFNAAVPTLVGRRSTSLGECHEDKPCPADLVKRCRIQASTTAATTTTRKPSTSARTTVGPTHKPSVAAASSVDGALVETKKGKADSGYDSKESDGPNLSQLVEALGKRTQRTQRFLIVILVISIINSLVLIALLVYLFRRSRFCCGRGGKGLYVISKEPPNHPFIDNNGKTT